MPGRISARWCGSLLLGAAIGAGVMASACSSDSTVTTSPTAPKCQVTLAAPTASLAADGGTAAITVTTSPECPWTVSTGTTWLSGLSPASGQGPGAVEFRAAANPLPATRQGEIVVNDTRVMVSQQAAACRIELRSAGLTIDAGGGSGAIAVAAPNACTWTAAPDADWIALTTPATQSGDGTVGLAIAANRGAERRLGAVTVGDQRFVVTQDADAPRPGCQYQVTSASQGVVPSHGGDLAAAVTATTGCAWTASSSVPWITVRSGAGGTGSGNVAFAVAANPGGVRTGTVAVAGQTFTITQAAAATAPCSYALGSTAASLPASGGSGTFGVTAGDGCAWTASSSAAWLTIGSGGSGAGSGTVAFTAAPNTGIARTASITAAGQTFTVSQAAATAAPCSFAVAPTTVAVPESGGDRSVVVSAAAGCAWTAASNVGWLTLTAGAAGSGDGVVAFGVAANTGAARTGTLTVAGQVITVDQAAAPAPPPCTYTIAPAGASVGALGGTGAVTVTAGAGCGWTATSSAFWITVTSGASGAGSGAVAFAVAPNLGGARSGTLTVAGQPFTVTQEALLCTYAIEPTSVTVPAPGDTVTVTVLTGATCAWTAVSTDNWLKVSSGSSGTGNGTVAVIVGPHKGKNARTGTVTIAGLTFTVRQTN